MANTHASHLHLPTLLLIFLLLISSSSARLLITTFSLPASATQPTLNIALPTDTVNAGVGGPEKKAAGHVMPRDMEVTTVKSSPEMRVRAPRLAGKYGPLILPMLPKGPVPPSGPSKRINDVQN